MAKTQESQSPVYQIEQSEDNNRLHLKVQGLGTISLSRSAEGLIIDVWNRDSTECIGTLGLIDEDFAPE